MKLRPIVILTCTLIAIVFAMILLLRSFILSDAEGRVMEEYMLTVFNKATSSADVQKCFELPAGPLVWTKDLGNPWKPGWNPKTIHYPQKSCIAQYVYELQDASACDFYDDVPGNTTADQAYCYRHLAQVQNDSSLCNKMSATDYYCLALTEGNLDWCYRVAQSQEFYQTTITTANCIQMTDYYRPPNERALSSCYLIDHTTGSNWKKERNSCLSTHASMLKGKGQEYCYLYDDLALEYYHDASGLFADCNLLGN